MISDATEQNDILRESAREFAEAEIGPHVMKWDEAQHFPLELVPKMGELGMMGAIAPPELGGAGLSYPEYVVLIEELSRVDGSIGLFAAAHNSLCTNHICVFGTEKQKQHVPGTASGRAVEPGESRKPDPVTRAACRRRYAGDHYVLNGAKHFTTNASVASVYVIMALTARGFRRS